MISLIKTTLLLTTFSTPLLSPIKGLGYEQVKVSFFVSMLTICGILWLIYSVKHPIKIVWTNIKKTVLIFILVFFITSILGIDPFNSFIGSQPYFQGWVLYAYLFLFFMLVAWLKIELQTWAYILVGSSTLVGILAIYQWVQINLMNQHLPTYAGRVVSSFGQPNFYSGFILFTLPFIYYLLAKTKKRLFFLSLIAILLMSTVSIIISQSKTAILLMIFLSFIFLATRLKKWLFLFGFIFFGTLIISVFFSNSYSSGILWGQLIGLKLSDDPDLTVESVEKRPYLWQVGVNIFLARPLVGYGLENIEEAYSNYFKQNKHKLFEENLSVSPILLSLKDLNIDRTHNFILDLLLFSGILGLISWMFLVFFAIKKLLKSKLNLKKSILLTGLGIYLVWIQFQNQSFVHLLYFWLITGLVDKE